MSAAADLVGLTFDAGSGIATVTFNRPDVFNALDIPLAAAFEAATAILARTPGLRCVVLTGAGKAFMAGGDVGSFGGDFGGADRLLERLLNHMHPAILTLRKIDAPVLAAVNGVAAGAGLSLVAGADYVVAARSARLVMAYDKLGVPPDCGGTWFLARKLGRAQAFEMMLMGRTLTAEEGLGLGLVNAVAEDADFAAKVEEAAATIAAGPTRAFGRFKHLMDADQPLAVQLELERDGFVASTRTADFRAGVEAFLGKRKPSFTGE